MVKNFTRDSAEFIKAGAPICPEEEYTHRMDICISCEHYTEKQSCGICGCHMPVKAGWKTTECADNPKKWRKLTDADHNPDIYTNQATNKELDPRSILMGDKASAPNIAMIRKNNFEKVKNKSREKE